MSHPGNVEIPVTANILPLRFPILYGSASSKVLPSDQIADATHTHIWNVYLRGLDNQDLRFFIEKVKFTLHESFESPDRVFHLPSYQVKESGWGEFTILITISFSFPNLDPIVLSQNLQLHPKEGNITQKDSAGREWVVAEVYDELEFWTPCQDLIDILANNVTKVPEEGRFGGRERDKERRKLAQVGARVQRECEAARAEGMRMENEIREAREAYHAIQESLG